MARRPLPVSGTHRRARTPIRPAPAKVCQAGKSTPMLKRGLERNRWGAFGIGTECLFAVDWGFDGADRRADRFSVGSSRFGPWGCGTMTRDVVAKLVHLEGRRVR